MSLIGHSSSTRRIRAMFGPTPVVMFAAIACLPSCGAVATARVQSRRSSAELAPYPPMMWHSWGLFTHENEVNEANMKQMGDALVSSGMAAAGYDTLNVVCNGWTGRDPVTHQLQENKTLWPGGMRALAAYLRAKNPPIKLGCYTAPNVANCNCGSGSYHGCAEPGSLGNEDVDMNFFAEIGCQHVMVDMPGSYADDADFKEKFAVIGAAIANSSNPNMVYGVWSGGLARSWKWAASIGGTYWRMATDIYDGWGSVLRQFDVTYSVPDIQSFTAPGRFSFLDQMIIGDIPGRPGSAYGPGLNADEVIAHFSMWVMAASPLMTCVDVRNMTTLVANTLTNDEVLQVHKDPLARMATRIDVGGGDHELESASICPTRFPVCQEYGNCSHCISEVSVYAKPLHDNSTAVMVFNRGDSPTVARFLLADLENAAATVPSYNVRDLWQKSWLANRTTAPLSLTVAAHGVRLLRVYPTPPPPPRVCPPGWQSHAGGYWANLDPCNACPHDYKNATAELCAAKCNSAAGCVAFEVYEGPSDPSGPSCFLFVGGLKPPFTPNTDCLTCVKPTSATPNREASPVSTQGFSVGNGSFLLNGKPMRLFAGSLQHFRIPDQHWEHRLQLARSMGLNAVQTLIPWWLMEPTQGEFVVEGPTDIVRFANLCTAHGLSIVLRPGPFICDGPDFGGLPFWLSNTRIRTADPTFLAHVTSFYTKLFSLLRAHNLTADLGGPIIMAQVDNEYGLFGSDKVYLAYIRDLWRSGLGPGVVIHSTDPPTAKILGGSRLPGILQTADFAYTSSVADNFAALIASQQQTDPAPMPLMCSEFYTGNLNFWGDVEFATAFPDAAVAQGLDRLLSTSIEGHALPSFTLWLFCGCTDFGWWGGSLFMGDTLRWLVPSYDFGAPVDEAGVVRPMFYALRKVLQAHGAVIPASPLPPPPPVRAYGAVVMREQVPLWDALSVLAPYPVQSPTVRTFEEIGLGYGYALYSTIIPPWTPPDVSIGGMRDRALVFVDQTLRQLCERGSSVDAVVCLPTNNTPARQCPLGWQQHEGGFWTNLDPCNDCPHDHQNATAALCAIKCNSTRDCVAFEVYVGPSDADSCFLFVGGLKLPFTSNPDCLTCVKPSTTTSSTRWQDGDGSARGSGSHVDVHETNGTPLDILVENLGRVTGGVLGSDLSFRGISRWVAASGQTLANWSIAPLPLNNVSALSTLSWQNSSVKIAADGTPRFYRGRFSVPSGGVADTFLTLFGWGKGQAFINGFNLQRYWGIGPQYSFYCPAEVLVEGENQVVLFETSYAPLNFTVEFRANHSGISATAQ